MVVFHEEAASLFERHGMSLTADLGRRNTLLSAAQEKFFGDEIASRFPVTCDGRPGQPDITVRAADSEDVREIECKLTTRTSSGGINLQTDYDTLCRKGTLDYLYVIASPDFTEFCVMYFRGLTPEDFRSPAAGSRGKSTMVKHRCFEKATVLVGDYVSLRDQNIGRIEAALLGKVPPGKRRRLESALEHWRAGDDKYSIRLEKITDPDILTTCAEKLTQENETWNLTEIGSQSSQEFGERTLPQQHHRPPSAGESPAD